MDDLIRAWIVGHRTPGLDAPMWALSEIARGGAIFIASGLALWIANRCTPRAFLELVLAIALAAFASDAVLKPLVGRMRPFMHDTARSVIGTLPSSMSFPSGHTANAVAGAVVLSAIAPGARLVWWSLAAGVAYSRIYLGMHYPLDVLGGAIVGFLAALLTGLIVRKHPIRRYRYS
jgi:undecaprenyl-diphosphatase